ncbi:MAG: hypothetical protein ACKV1O_07135 [Saprospiraceae bacterium]
MKNAFFPLAFLLSLHSLFAQQDIALPGLVVEQNSKYKTGAIHHLDKVSIQSIPSCGPAISNSEGCFKLVFSDYRGGSSIKIFAQKAGYEVVNQKELDNAAILGRYEPLKIVMCKAGELANKQVKYYQIGVEAIEKSYHNKIALLDKEGKEKETLVQSLRERHQVLLTEKTSILYYLEKDKAEALAQVHTFSERFAEVNLDDADSLYVAAYEAYIDKRIEDVYRILDLQVLEQNIEKAKAEIARGKAMVAYADSVKAYNLSMLEKFARSGWLAADAAVKTSALEQARQYYEQSIKAAPCNLAIRYAYAQFLTEYWLDPTGYLDNLEQSIHCLEKAEKNEPTHQMVELFYKHTTSEPHALTDETEAIDRLQQLR